MKRVMERRRYEVLREERKEDRGRVAPPRRGLIGRIVAAVADCFRPAAATTAAATATTGTGNNCAAVNTTAGNDEDNDYDAAKCVVATGMTYCWNCRQDHHALVPQNLKK